MFIQHYIYLKSELDKNKNCPAYKVFTNGRNAHNFAENLSYRFGDVYVYKVDVRNFSLMNERGILDITHYASKCKKNKNEQRNEGRNKYVYSMIDVITYFIKKLLPF